MAQDPLRAKKADRWDALVKSGVSPNDATARVEQEFTARAQKADRWDALTKQGVAPDKATQQVEEEFTSEPSFGQKAKAVLGGTLTAPQAVFNQTVASLAGIGKSDEEKRGLAQAAALMNQQHAPANEKLERTFQTAQMVAGIPVQAAKYVLAGSLNPLAAVGLGAAEATGSAPEGSSAGMAAALAKRFGAERMGKGLEAVSSSGIGRAAFDVALGKMMELGMAGAGKA